MLNALASSSGNDARKLRRAIIAAAVLIVAGMFASDQLGDWKANHEAAACKRWEEGARQASFVAAQRWRAINQSDIKALPDYWTAQFRVEQRYPASGSGGVEHRIVRPSECY